MAIKQSGDARIPSVKDRRDAVEEMRVEHKKHMERQGKMPDSRKIEKYWTDIAEKRDRDLGY